MADPRDTAPGSPGEPGPPGRRSGRPSAWYGATSRALRSQLGWIVVALGAALCFLGWYGVSGERYTAQQVPFLASATAPGVALILGGIVLVAVGRRTVESAPQQERTLRQLELLYELLTEEAASAAVAGPDSRAAAGAATGPGPASESDTGDEPGTAEPAAAVTLLAVPGGGTYHLADCLLVQGRADPQPAEPDSVVQRGLYPCPLCEPPSFRER